MFNDNNFFSGGAAGAFYDYEIGASLRYDEVTGPGLSFTTGTPTSYTTVTFSCWVKRGVIGDGDRKAMLWYGDANYNTGYCLGVEFVSDKLGVLCDAAGTYWPQTDAVFRDASAWYHVVVAMDSTESTSTDRVKIWVNGEQYSYTGTPIPLNSTMTLVNETCDVGGPLVAQNGYLAEVHLIDGQALDPTYFGETKSGVWIPKQYTGTYGNNGIYLDFNTSLTADQSGNGNNFTASAGTTSTDVVLDSPTNNFATLNPLDNAGLTFSEGNLKFSSSSASHKGCRSSMSITSGKFYFESLVTSVTNAVQQTFSLARDNVATPAQPSSNVFGMTIGLNPTASNIFIYNNGSYNGYTSRALAIGDVLRIAYDADTGKVWYGVNNDWLDDSGATDATANPSTGSNPTLTLSETSLSPYVHLYNTNAPVVNFGQDSSFAGNKTAQGNTDDNGYGDFYYAPPTGYLALCTANLTVPDAMNPALDNSPQDYFNTVLYTGNGANLASGGQSITGVGFQPDFVWIKERSGADWHGLFDVVRGVGKHLGSNTTAAEQYYGDAGLFNSFDSDGFSVNTTWNGGTNTTTNGSGQTTVAWNWKANGSGVSNTDGSITSTVSANTDAGFSIVSYSGNSTAGATVGHGLTSTPELIIVKKRNGADPWQTYSATLGGTKRLELNAASAAITSTASWNDTDPTSTVFTLGSGGYGNASGYNYIAYCFHSVEGFSKFGSYIGNGSADGTFVYTGFRPAFVLLKAVNDITSWILIDTKRDTYNPEVRRLLPNYSNAEATGFNMIDGLSNGFKLRDSNVTWNSSQTYIYMAFAENPFKYANAR